MNSKYENNSPVNSNFYNDLYRSNIPLKKDNKKLNFRSMKNNTISSLNEVEHFLNNFQHAIRYIKLYKFLK